MIACSIPQSHHQPTFRWNFALYATPNLEAILTIKATVSQNRTNTGCCSVLAICVLIFVFCGFCFCYWKVLKFLLTRTAVVSPCASHGETLTLAWTRNSILCTWIKKRKNVGTCLVVPATTAMLFKLVTTVLANKPTCLWICNCTTMPMCFPLTTPREVLMDMIL